MADLLEGSLWATKLNIVWAIASKIITFALNAFVLRLISGHVLGIINVRLLLLVDSILFISREAFRKACLKKPENNDWKGTFNLVWLSVPIGIFASIFLGYIWAFVLELPEDPNLQDQYQKGVALMCLSAIIELSFEPFFIVGQIFMWFGFRTFVDGCGHVCRAVLLALIVKFYPDNTILLFGWSYVLSVTIQWILYFTKVAKIFRENAHNFQPLNSILDLFPSPNDCHVDQERRILAFSFLRQGLLKQLLTEGEKYLFTIFSLMTLADQGVYDVIANLGSLAPRLVFSKIEEGAYLYFNQKVQRGSQVQPQISKQLFMYLRTMSLIAWIVFVFGYSYSHLLLYIYGGANLTSGLGPTLLRGHCFYVLFLAVNGVSECFSFALMTSDQVNSFNYKMSVMTIVFLHCAWSLVTILGPIGFILANCCNFAMRIAHSCYVIHRHGGSEALKGFLPSPPSMVSLIVSGILCQVSERLVYDPSEFGRIMAHLVVGGFCFFNSLIVIFNTERDYIQLKNVKGHTE